MGEISEANLVIIKLFTNFVLEYTYLLPRDSKKIATKKASSGITYQPCRTRLSPHKIHTFPIHPETTCPPSETPTKPFETLLKLLKHFPTS